MTGEIKSNRLLLPLAILITVVLLPGAAKPQAQHPFELGSVYSLPSGVSVTLPGNGAPLTSDLGSPPPLLAGSAPPVHFTEVLVLENQGEKSVFQLATSNNPFVGHDEYWLDGQMHSPKDSVMSLPNFLFYLFFPPPYTCLTGAEDSYAGAGRTPVEGDEAPDLEVYLTCQFRATLPDFYAAQISTRIVLRKMDDQLRAIAVLNDFYLAPMEVVDFSGMTFYVFEAKAANRITGQARSTFNLPDAFEGAQADFFWAIGAQSPFPFTHERARVSNPIIHLVYAGIGTNERPEFIRLLHQVRGN